MEDELSSASAAAIRRSSFARRFTSSSRSRLALSSGAQLNTAVLCGLTRIPDERLHVSPRCVVAGPVFSGFIVRVDNADFRLGTKLEDGIPQDAVISTMIAGGLEILTGVVLDRSYAPSRITAVRYDTNVRRTEGCDRTQTFYDRPELEAPNNVARLTSAAFEGELWHGERPAFKAEAKIDGAIGEQLNFALSLRHWMFNRRLVTHHAAVLARCDGRTHSPTLEAAFSRKRFPLLMYLRSTERLL